jgi:hypothetical protein
MQKTQTQEKGFIPVWLVVLVVSAALLAGGVYITQIKTQSQGSPTPSPSSSTMRTETPIATQEVSASSSPGATSQLDISDWKTYSNDVYGFTLRYPKEWSAEESLKDKIYFERGKTENRAGETMLQISILREQYLDIAKGVYVHPSWGQSKTDKLTLAGMTVSKITAPSPSGPSFVYVFVARGNAYRFEGKAQAQVVENMISSFSLSAIPATGWKKYTNDQYGFTLNYPSDTFFVRSYKHAEDNGLTVEAKELGLPEEGAEGVPSTVLISIEDVSAKNIRTLDALLADIKSQKVFESETTMGDLISNIKKIDFRGYKAYQYTASVGANSHETILLLKSGISFEIDVSYGFGKPDDNHKKILDSFEFVTQSVVPTISPIMVQPPISYKPNDALFSASSSTFSVLEQFTPQELAAHSQECGTNKNEQYYRDLLAKYSNQDTGVKYVFQYKGISQDERDWSVMVIPNKLGYSDRDGFGRDFDICAAGYEKYPSLVSTEYLLFSASCGTGYDDGSGRPHGCDEVEKFVEPTIELK